MNLTVESSTEMNSVSQARAEGSLNYHGQKCRKKLNET